ncbi:MAG TPA: hypothetical protein VGW77_30620 [Candidatus Binatia bacterium]|jgi:deoxycytidine triphosphate deaminase|nr:hypothetical protein [Candidatus Binatia bacterium]
MAEDYSAYQVPKSDEEALARFGQFEHHDPLPDVPPALLNAGDIYDYARIMGMIWPFESEEKQLKQKLKPASYEVDFLGDIYFADQDGNQKKIEIRRETPFILPKNSIAFVFLATQFRLPDYIALRFNLKITHVHRGLLLGTGPLIDPGFSGRLLIPLHNLTSKDYTLIGGEGVDMGRIHQIITPYSLDRRCTKKQPGLCTFPVSEEEFGAAAILQQGIKWNSRS